MPRGAHPPAGQEINAIVRPSDETLAFCAAHGCRFVSYGPLLGGLLSDEYLGAARPTPDADHSKQVVAEPLAPILPPVLPCYRPPVLPCYRPRAL